MAYKENEIKDFLAKAFGEIKEVDKATVKVAEAIAAAIAKAFAAAEVSVAVKFDATVEGNMVSVDKEMKGKLR